VQIYAITKKREHIYYNISTVRPVGASLCKIFLSTRIFSKSVSQKPLYNRKGTVSYRTAWWCSGKAALSHLFLTSHAWSCVACSNHAKNFIFSVLFYATSMHSWVWLGQVRPGWGWLGWVGPLVIWGACPGRLGLVWTLITSKTRVGHLLMPVSPSSCRFL